MPVADPARISDEMVAALKVEGATTWVAVHANHPRELTGTARAACARLVDAGIPLVSQSVLLRGVNDDARDAGGSDASFRRMPDQALLSASRRSRAGHRASAHDDSREGQELMRQLRGRVSGLCQPDYVSTFPAAHGKAPVGPNYLSHAKYRGTVIYRHRKRAIVSSIIAATFISIRPRP